MVELAVMDRRFRFFETPLLIDHESVSRPLATTQPTIGSIAKWNKERNYFISSEKIFWKICKVRILILKIAATYRTACIFVA